MEDALKIVGAVLGPLDPTGVVKILTEHADDLRDLFGGQPWTEEQLDKWQRLAVESAYKERYKDEA